MLKLTQRFLSRDVVTHFSKMHLSKFYICSLIILCFSCQGKIDCKIDQTIIAINDSIIAKAHSDSEAQKEWNEYLGKLKEPSFKTEKVESYRLIIYNLMWSSSKSYRIAKDSDSYKFVFKEYGGEQIERENSVLTKEYEKEISEKQWNDFKELTNKISFWSLPVKDEKNGLDGTSWLLEGKMPTGNNCTNRNYHVVSRWQPEDTLKIMKLNKMLINLHSE